MPGYSEEFKAKVVEKIDYKLLFRWFIGLSKDAPIWDHSTFTKNRDRLLEANIARHFFAEVVDQKPAGRSSGPTSTSVSTAPRSRPGRP